MNVPSLSHLRTLVTVVEAGSLARAARELSVSQPALSMQLKKFEQSLAFPVFDFEGKRKVLTPYGRALYRSAVKQLAKLELAFESLNRRFVDSKGLTLRVGCRRELVPGIAKLINFPGTVSFYPMPSDRAIKRLGDRKIDVAITHEYPDSPEIIAKELFSSRPALVVHEKWIPVGKLTLGLANSREFLTKTPCLAYGRKAPLLREWITRRGLTLDELKIAYLCDDWTVLMQFVESGAGYCIMPDDIQKNSAQVKYVYLPDELAPRVRHYALYHRALRKFPAFRDIFGSRG